MSSIETVASTLFPECWYVPERAAEPRAHLYWCRERAARVHHRISGPNEVETYFDRLVAYPDVKSEPVNQLEEQVLRLQRELRHAEPKGSAYEIGVSEPGDLRIQRPGKDRRMMSFPCLSRISLTLHTNAIHLTALYRNQGFLRKAYGNYVGLARLARFFAREAGVGVDVVDLVEFQHNLLLGGPRWLRKLFTEAEIAAAKGQPERLGTRFAAKKAVVKALGTGFRAEVSARCVEIVSDPEGRPRVVLAGAAAVAASAMEVGEVRVSMSQEGGCAVAVALAVSSE